MKYYSRIFLSFLFFTLFLFSNSAYGEEIASDKGILTDAVWTLYKTSGFQFITRNLFDSSNDKITSKDELLEYSGILFTVQQDYLFTVSSSINFGFHKTPPGFFMDDSPDYQKDFSSAEYEIHISHSFKPSTIFSFQPFLGFMYFNCVNKNITTNDSYYLHDSYHTLVGGIGFIFDPKRWFSFKQNYFFSPYTDSDIAETKTHFSIYYATTTISFNTRFFALNFLFSQRNIFDIASKKYPADYRNTSSVTEFGISFSAKL